MHTSKRKYVIAGPLIALILVPAPSAVGMFVFINEWALAARVLMRLGVDVALGLVVMFLKQKLFYQRGTLCLNYN